MSTALFEDGYFSGWTTEVDSGKPMFQIAWLLVKTLFDNKPDFNSILHDMLSTTAGDTGNYREWRIFKNKYAVCTVEV